MLGLEYLVKKTDLSYTSLANRLGVSTQTVHKWAKKIKPIPDNHLKTLSEIFKLEKEYISQELSISVIGGLENQELKNTINQSFLSFESPYQVANIAFQPNSDKVGQQNFKKTMEQPVPQSIIQQYLSSEEMEQIKSMYNNKGIEVWGVKEGKNGVTKKQYNKLSPGDVVLFYKEWYLYCKAIVTFKIHSPELAKALWNDDNFEYIYFLTNVESCQIPVEVVNHTIYRKNERFAIMGFKVLTSEQSELLLNKLELETEPQLKEITKEDYQKAITLKIDKPLDSVAKRVGRVEQGYLRKLLFGKRLYEKCACCGNLYPVSHLFAAHIKKRSLCSVEEKLDSQVVIPMCKFGCDTLYEDGFISVDSTGHFIRLDKVAKKNSTPRVDTILEELNGRKCSYWNLNTAKYFEWHYQYHSKL
ncbi:helix-turn-helix domain-containing protein [Priestia megaterium]|uniref:helix-turn-helix domain-containing protein n=1 Tax=Priestia megaterium TaxID=1404 RepID=UPI0021D6789D|nr:helix-turn-helix domain-containing protein [Priestia megaterium]MCU7766491.1 helix-turn-helix domain-containing protein [Priestia megaterium]